MTKPPIDQWHGALPDLSDIPLGAIMRKRPLGKFLVAAAAVGALTLSALAQTPAPTPTNAPPSDPSRPPPPIPDPRVKDMDWTEISPAALPGNTSRKWNTKCQLLVRGAPYRVCMSDLNSSTGGALRYYTISGYNCPPDNATVFFITAYHDPRPRVECDQRAYERSVELFQRLGASGLSKLPNNPMRTTPDPEPIQTGQVVEPETKVGMLNTPGSFASNVAYDGETFCTFGNANGVPISFVPSDADGKPASPTIGTTSPTIDISDVSPEERRRINAQRAAQAAIDREIAIQREIAEKLEETPATTVTPTATPGGHIQPGTAGRDRMVGEPGYNEYSFNFNARNTANGGTTTLDDGDTITGYKSGEPITITGIGIPDLGGNSVKLVYIPPNLLDGTGERTIIELRIRDKDGNIDPAAEPNKRIILEGDKRGQVQVLPDGRETQIQIIIPGQEKVQPGRPRAPAVRQAEKGPPVPGGAAPPKEDPPAKQAAPAPAPAPASEPKVGNKDAEAPPKTATEDKGVTPPPEQKTPGEKTASKPPSTVHFKATEAAIQAGSQVAELKDFRTKLTAKEPPLPKTGTTTKASLDKGFDKSPVMCKTGNDGGCRAQLDADEREVYGFPADGPLNYLAQLPIWRNTGIVLQGDPKAALPDAPRDAIIQKHPFKIGDRPFTRLAIAGSDASAKQFFDKVSKQFGARAQLDACIVIEPGPPAGSTDLTSNPDDELDGAHITLRSKKRSMAGRQ